jgi:TonB family protein
MLLNHFGLREDPFGVTPDPRFLFKTRGHGEAITSLVRGIETGRGFMALLAEPGMGKTSLLHMLLEHIGPSARTAFVFQTQCTARELFGYLLADFEVKDLSGDIVTMNWRLNEVLMSEARAGRRCVAIIDEAQNLDDDALEAVRLLSDFETSKSKLLQIVLAGQPGLSERLSSTQQEQLRQRLSSISWLYPLTPEDVPRYIHHRLQVAGCRQAVVFTDQSMEAITEYSGGVPRNINNICFNAMSLCCAEMQERVDLRMVEEVVSDLELRQTKRTPIPNATPTPIKTEFENRRDYGVGRPAEPPAAGAQPRSAAQPRSVDSFKASDRVKQIQFPPQASASVAPSFGYSRESAAVASVSIPELKMDPMPTPVLRDRVRQHRHKSRNGLRMVFAALLLLAPTALLISQFWPIGSANSDGLPPASPHAAKESAPIESTDSLSLVPVPKAPAAASSLAPKASAAAKPQAEKNVRQDPSDVGQSNVERSTRAKPQTLTPAMGSFDPKSRNPEQVAPPTVSTPAGTNSNSKAPPFLVADSSKLPVLRSVPQPPGAATNVMTEESTHTPTRIIRPQYPDLAFKAKVHGDVEVEALVGKDGSVRDVTVIKGHPLLKGAAVDAVRQWRYEPYRFNGRPVEFQVRVIISFKLQNSSRM